VPGMRDLSGNCGGRPSFCSGGDVSAAPSGQEKMIRFPRVSLRFTRGYFPVAPSGLRFEILICSGLQSVFQQQNRDTSRRFMTRLLGLILATGVLAHCRTRPRQTIALLKDPS